MNINWEQVAEFGPVAAQIAVALVVSVLAYYIIRHALNAAASRHSFPKRLNGLLRGLSRWIIILVLAVVVLQILEMPVAALWAAISGVLVMVAIGFVAVWSILSNVLSAVLILVFAPFRLGDRIEITETNGAPGLRGEVVGLNMLYVSLEEKAENGETHTVRVPNNLFFQKIVRCLGGETPEADDSEPQ